MFKPHCNNDRTSCCLRVLAVLLVVICTASANATQLSEPVGYELGVCESLDVLKKPSDMHAAMMAAWDTPTTLAKQRSEPYMYIKNTNVGGTGDAQLKDFYLNIGNSDNTFDWAKIIKTPAGVTAKVVGLDSKNGGTTNDVLHIKFTGFEPGMKVYFQVDIDPNKNLMYFGDYRTVLFQMITGNDTSDNALHRARFYDPSLPSDFQKFLTPYAVWDNEPINYPTTIGMTPRATYSMDHVQPFYSGNSGLQPVPEPEGILLAGLGLLGMAICWYRRRVTTTCKASV